MGCGESRVKRISLTSDQDWEGTDKWEKSTDVVTKQVVQELSVSALQQPIIKEEENVKPFKNIWEGLDSRATAPNRLLDSIPTSDLGESLDCRPRRVVEVENRTLFRHKTSNRKHRLTSMGGPGPLRSQQTVLTVETGTWVAIKISLIKL